MARVLITGSADGLGLMAAQLLLDEGHDVTFHARSAARADDLRRDEPRAKSVLVGDLASLAQTRDVAGQANALGPLDAVIHNAGVGYRQTAPGRDHGRLGRESSPSTCCAPYLLTALITRPRPAGLPQLGHVARAATPAWTTRSGTRRRWNGAQAYSDSKLYDTVLALAVARRWPGVLSNAVEPGWVATRMGGAGAPDDLAQGPVTQAWLAVSDDPAATVSGGYSHPSNPGSPTPPPATPHSRTPCWPTAPT